jgi:hypothetical protein
MKAKKPIRVSVTAAMAAMRVAPSVLKNSARPCTAFLGIGRERVSPGKICPVYGFHLVNED